MNIQQLTIHPRNWYIFFFSSFVPSLLSSLGHKCPSTFNPADYYIHTLAVLPGHEHRSRERIKRICDNFAVSAYSKDIDITIQYQDNMCISQSDSGASVSSIS